ncbi:MAG: hypothetical protein KF734_21855 [Saprospiraceae bacterium]|nr:hypothetical protein [Saprospiraceae bacterium]
MNDNFFDKQIKTTLDNLEAPYDASTWAMLEQRLNAPFLEEQPAAVDAVDKAVFRTLERLEAPYQPAHWNMLANRMQQTSLARRRVWVAKLLEAAIFLLLLANLEGFLGSGTSRPQRQPEKKVAPPSDRPQADRNVPLDKHKAAMHTVDALSNAHAASHLLDVAAVQQFDETIASALGSPSEEQRHQNLLESLPTHWASMRDVMSLPVLPTHSVRHSQSSPIAFAKVKVKAPKQHRFYAATFAHVENNKVRSGDYSNTSTGHGGGMAIGYRIGQWGVEAGLSYNRRQFEPKKQIEIYAGSTVQGFHGSFATNVEADVVAVPVKVTRRVAKLGQATAHAVGGITTNFAVTKNFDYGSVFYPAPSSSSDPNPPTQAPKLRKDGKGVFEGGGLRENVYASADVGLRVEHPIGQRFAAFVEPAYRMALGSKGIGPNPARLNTFAVQAGVLATL